MIREFNSKDKEQLFKIVKPRRKKIMQFAINKALENENKHIYIGAIDWNTRALNLYQRLGFDIVQTNQCYRLFKFKFNLLY